MVGAVGGVSFVHNWLDMSQDIYRESMLGLNANVAMGWEGLDFLIG